MFDRVRALPFRQQLALALATASALCALLWLAWYLLLRADYRPLFTQLRPADAATIVGDLDRRRIPYRIEDGGSTILVPADAVDRTRLDVMASDLPLKGTVGFELFNKSDLGLTDFAQKINYQRALQGELERTIMTLDGIDSARVHLSLGEDRIFRDDRVPPKASVTIRMRDGQAFGDRAAQGVQRLIAAAVPNLDPADVVILDESGRVIGAPVHVEAQPGTGSPEEQEKSAIEQYYQAVLRSTLEKAYPELGITASVAASPDTSDRAALADWNPAARTFPLQVTLASPALIDAPSQEGVRSLVSGIIRSSPTVTDNIQFAIVPPAAKQIADDLPKPRALTLPKLPGAPIPEDDEGMWRAASILLAMMLAAGAGLFLLASRRSRKLLSDNERGELSAKLRKLLAKDEAHARS